MAVPYQPFNHYLVPFISPFSAFCVHRSAMFNVLVIVALSAAVAAKNGVSGIIDHRVVARDICFYTCSILLLVTSVNDDQIEWWEVSLPSRYFLLVNLFFTGQGYIEQNAVI